MGGGNEEEKVEQGAKVKTFARKLNRCMLDLVGRGWSAGL